MRLSESLRRGIMETVVGGIINKFKVKSRRDILFFEDILAKYILECEKAGQEEMTERVGNKWMYLTAKCFLPHTFNKLPLGFLFNQIGKKIWTNIGLMDNLKVEKKENNIKIETRNEYITRVIGKNRFSVGGWGAFLRLYFNLEFKRIEAAQKKEKCTYVFSLGESPFEDMESKDKDLYIRLNQFKSGGGVTLKKALKAGIIQLKQNNRMYFRGKSLIPIENTLFHLFSAESVLLDSVPFLSHEFFREIVDKDTTDDKKLNLLKNVLHSTGWGTIKIKLSSKITFSIYNPPYGLQREKDDWTFLINVILGYLWLIDNKLKISNVKESYRNLEIVFSR